MSDGSADQGNSPVHKNFFIKYKQSTALFIASLAALFFELLIIRYISTEIRIFAYLKNLPLIAGFLGIGLGMILGRVSRLERLFPFLFLATFSLIRFSSYLGLTYIGFPDGNYVLFGSQGYEGLPVFVLLFKYVLFVLAVLALIVFMFIVLGGLIGQYLKCLNPLHGYGTNLIGSFLGILLFTVLAFLRTPPYIWLLTGCLMLVPFWRKSLLAIAVFGIATLIQVTPQGNTFWSPYYRIDLSKLPQPLGYDGPSAYNLDVNHDYHQRIIDLSKGFVEKYPTVEPNKSSLLTYELPYRFISRPRNVLIVGAGTGNDVAAALRNGAQHIDAVEIDPQILELGRLYHPERPYASDRVTTYVDDARAFFGKTHRKYDLIVFGYLDSHTLLSSMSSVRLDNYVYTLQSIKAARSLLKPDGTMALSFSGGVPFINERFYSMLRVAFGTAPLAFKTDYDTTGIAFVESTRVAPSIPIPVPEIGEQLRNAAVELPTDSWPFLYLRHRSVPASMMVILIAFLICARRLLKKTIGTSWTANTGYLQMFFLGAAFMLLETKATTDLSLLFGSTWLVNAVVIGAFLLMGFLANLVVQFRRGSAGFGYILTLIALGLTLIVPLSRFIGATLVLKLFAVAVLVALPVFFSGVVFSRTFSQSLQPQRALGINLFGAMAGGMLENLVMIGGTPLLGIVALLLYGTAAISWLRGPLTDVEFTHQATAVP